MPQAEKTTDQEVFDRYRQLVLERRPGHVSAWPIISGHNFKYLTCRGWHVLVYEHTGNSIMRSSFQLGELPPSVAGNAQIDASNKNALRERIEHHYRLKPDDAVFLMSPNGDHGGEFEAMYKRHEYAMGLAPNKIFLSHKGSDKALVRRFKAMLQELGFDSWLDEEAMSAGTELERGILRGFKDSCAAVFFITPNFTDENFLATEVDYAIAEKREKGDRFSIVTLVFEHDSQKGSVPQLLRRYVWKEPATELDALWELVRALPVAVGAVTWRS